VLNKKAVPNFNNETTFFESGILKEIQRYGYFLIIGLS